MISGDTVKQWATAARELALTGLIVLLILWPTEFSVLVNKVGITELPGGIKFSLKQANDDTKTLAKQLQDLQAQQAQVGELIDRAINSHNSADLLNTLQEAHLKVVATAEQTDEAAKKTLAKQQDILKSVDIQTPSDGWIYVGKLDDRKQAWLDGGPRAIWPAKPTIAAGDIISIKDDVYLRDDPPAAGIHSRGTVLGVLKVGEKVTVKDVDMVEVPGTATGAANATLQPSGGYSVWLKVSAT